VLLSDLFRGKLLHAEWVIGRRGVLCLCVGGGVLRFVLHLVVWFVPDVAVHVLCVVYPRSSVAGCDVGLSSFALKLLGFGLVPPFSLSLCCHLMPILTCVFGGGVVDSPQLICLPRLCVCAVRVGVVGQRCCVRQLRAMSPQARPDSAGQIFLSVVGASPDFGDHLRTGPARRACQALVVQTAAVFGGFDFFQSAAAICVCVGLDVRFARFTLSTRHGRGVLTGFQTSSISAVSLVLAFIFVDAVLAPCVLRPGCMILCVCVFWS